MKTVTVKIAEIESKVFVRTGLDPDRVLLLKGLVDAGVELEPIKVALSKETGKYVIVDGRHRIEVYTILGRLEIKARVLEIEDEVDLIGEAYRSNAGGALPPTKEDTEHTIRLLVDRKASTKQIAELLGLPAKVTRMYVAEVSSQARRARLRQATQAIAEGGLNVGQASEKYGVDVAELKVALGGKSKKRTNGVDEVTTDLSAMYKTQGFKISMMLKKLIEQVGEGDVLERQAREVFAHLEKLQKRSTHFVAERKARLNALTRGDGK